MTSLLRLTGNKIGNSFLKQESTGLLKFVRPVTLKATPAQAPPLETHDERNMRLKRPQSPHLTIYSYQVTSVLSISHRISGLVLASYAIGLGLGAVVLPETIPHYLESANLGGFGLTTLKFSLAFPMSYHFWNGIRHLLWDTGKFLTIKEVYLTGYIMLALTAISSIALSTM